MKKIAAIILSVIMLIVAVAAIVWHKEISTIRSVRGATHILYKSTNKH